MSLPKFGKSLLKEDWRTTAITQPWRHFTGLQAVNGPYVTLPGPMYDDGILQPTCELLHMLNVRFLTADQFHGIERDSDTHSANVSAVERSLPISSRPKLYHKDLIDFLEDSKIEPSIVNIDLLDGPKKGVTVLARALDTINRRPSPTMVVWNILVVSPHHKHDQRKHIPEALNHDLLRRAERQGRWERFGFRDEDGNEGPLEYRGSSKKGKTMMRTYVFWRPS